jgi:N-acetylmuramoyl-L-alanine amidase
VATFEIDAFPFVQARHFRATTGARAVRLIVIHSMEAPEKGDTAENVAHFFQTTDREASAHLCIDSDSAVRCVRDDDVAFAAPGANSDGVHLELAGFARQTEPEWLDAFGVLMLERAADVAAQYCLKYGIPARRLTNQELADTTNRGIVSHAQVSETFRKSDHTDPGSGFPWAFFLERVARNQTVRQQVDSNRSRNMADNIKVVRLKASDGPPTVEIAIGHAQFGKYELSLFDTDGRNPVVIGSGLSHDQLPDSFQIDGNPSFLHGRFLSWSANLIPAGNEANAQFSLTVHIRQRGVENAGSPIQTQGPLPAAHAEFGFVKLEVV